MKKRKIFLLFLSTVFIFVMGIISFIQSELFADLLKTVAQRQLPRDLGVDGEFKELSVKLIPPGVVIHKPSLSLKEENFANLPGGTKIEAEALDLTFQFFQLMTGEINVNAFAIIGAALTLDLDEKFFQDYEQRLKTKQSDSIMGMHLPSISLSWENIFRFKFRSVSILDSKVDIRLHRGGNFIPISVQAVAKELTVGRNTIDGFPAYDIGIDFQNAAVKFGQFDRKLAQFQSSIEVSSRGAKVRTLSMQEEDMTFHANGEVKGNILSPTRLDTDLNYIIKGPLQKLLAPKMLGFFVQLPKNSQADGNLALEGRLKADLLDLLPSMETKFSLTVDDPLYSGWRARRLSVHGEWKRPILAMTGASVDFGDGKVSFSRIDYDSREDLEALSVSAQLENADFRKLLGPAIKDVYPIHMHLSGDLNSEIDLKKGIRLKGTTALDITEFSFDNQKYGVVKPLMQLLTVPRLAIKSSFSLDEKGFQISNTELRINQTKLQATGGVDENGRFNIDVRGPVNLAEIKKLSAFEIAGEGDLHWTIKGVKPDVIFTFDAQLKNSRYLNMNLGSVNGRVIYHDGAEILTFQNLQANQHRSRFVANGTVDLGKTDAINVEVKVPTATIPDMSQVFERFIRDTVPWYPWDLNGRLDGVVRVSGFTDTSKLSVMGDMNLSNIEYLGEIFKGGTVHGGFRRGAYVAEKIDLSKRYGRITGDVVFGADSVLRMALKSHNATTLDIDKLAAMGIPYSAPLDLEVVANGKWGNLTGFIDTGVGAGVIKGYPIGASKLRIDMGDGRWRGNLSIFGAQFQNTFDIGWALGSQSQIEFKAKGFRFHPLLIALNTGLASDPQLYGNLAGAARFSFKTGFMSKLTGEFALDALEVKRSNYELSLAAPLKFTLRNGNYDFLPATLMSRANDSIETLKVRGRVSEGIISYDLVGGLHLRLLEFLTGEIAGSSGVAEVDARLSGSSVSPNLDGLIRVKNGYLRLSAVEQPFEDLVADITLKDNSVAVKRINAKFAGGNVRANGKALLYLTKVPEVDFQGEIDNARIKFYPVTFARSSGKLFLKGNQLPYSVTGNVKVAEALIRENFDLSEGSRVLRSSKFLPNRTGTPREYSLFDLNIHVSADRSVFVRNDLFDAELRGQMRVINSIKTPRLIGSIDVLSGKLLFKDSYFTIQSGSVRFTNPTVLDPEFDFSGYTEQRGYKVHLVAGGLVSDYKFNLTSQPPLTQNDIVNLLTLGVTSSEYQNISRENRDAYSRDELYGILFSSSGINRGLKEKFGLNVRLDQAQVATPENVFRARAADSTETVAPKVVLQKQVTKRLSASVGSTVGVGDNQERSASLEYDIHRNWSVLGTYEDQRGAQLKQSRTSVGADLKFRMRFK